MSEVACRKAINFDLDTKALKEHYPGKHYRKAYKDIKNFLIKADFEHRQWSGYFSQSKLTMQDVIITTKALVKAFPWIKDCVRHFDVTNIGDQHDLMSIICGNKIDKSKGAELALNKSSESLLAFSKNTKAIKKSYSTVVEFESEPEETECVFEENQGCGRGR